MPAAISSPPPLVRIICASADPRRRLALLGTLALPGRVVECVQDARQAVLCFEQHGSCDLVLTAHTLPDLDGVELVRRLRRAGFEGRVVVLCAAISAATAAAYRALGVGTILVEPVPPSVLTAAMIAA